MTQDFTGKAAVLKDGTVKLYTTPVIPDAGDDSDWKIYRRFEGKQWRLISSEHRIPDPADQKRSVTMYEQWVEGGGPLYTQDVKQNLDTGLLLLSRTTLEDSGALTAFSRNERLPYMLYNQVQYAADAELTYLHSVDADGKLGDMLSFKLVPVGHDEWKNTWSKGGGWNINSGGFPYGKGNLEPPAEPGVQYETYGQKFTIGWQLPLNRKDEIVDTLPGFSVLESSNDGNYVQTIRSFSGIIQFVYSGRDMKKLIQRTCRYKENDQWVTTTTRFETLGQWLNDRLLKVAGLTVSGFNSAPTESGFTFWFHAQTAETHWPINTDPSFLQYWVGAVKVEFARIGTVDGVDQFDLVKTSPDITWWRCRRDRDFNPVDNQPLTTLGITEDDFRVVVSRWNEKAVLDS